MITNDNDNHNITRSQELFYLYITIRLLKARASFSRTRMLISYRNKVGNAHPTLRKSVRVLNLTSRNLTHQGVLQQTDRDLGRDYPEGGRKHCALACGNALNA